MLIDYLLVINTANNILYPITLVSTSRFYLNYKATLNKAMEELHTHDMVALTVALPEYKLRRGEIGVIVDAGPDHVYLVEFVGKNGTPYAMPTIHADQLMKVYLQADLTS